MKTIDTLVEDIYSLFSSDNKNKKLELKKEDLDAFSNGIIAAVVSALSGREDKRTLRLSMIGQPNRKIWYELNGGKKKEIDPPTIIKFLYGNILEELLILFTKASGHTVDEMQKEVSVGGVVGHHDAIVDGTLVDFKSASDFGFKKFKEGNITKDDPFGYVAQISAYAHANKTSEAGFLAINKSSGEISYCPVHSMDFINPERRINEVKSLISQPEPPPRCYDAVPDGKSGNMRLAVGCAFCDYRNHCWQDANNGRGIRTFQYATGKKSLVKVMSEPDVPEITDEEKV